jgi:hypothetical protein
VRPVPFIPGRISDTGKNFGACAKAAAEIVRADTMVRNRRPQVLFVISSLIFARNVFSRD